MYSSASPVRRARIPVFLVSVAIALLAGMPASSATRSTSSLAAATGQDVVVFDIDGTLTTDEGSNSVQPSAAAAVNAYVAKGYDVVYVTARWRLLQESSTRSWLASNGFPSRTLVMSPNLLLSDSSKVRFKTSAMTTLEQGTPEIVGAYGDSSSDFTAYANVSVPRDRVFALKRRSAWTCQSGTYAACLTAGYTTHLPFINALPPGR